MAQEARTGTEAPEPLESLAEAAVAVLGTSHPAALVLMAAAFLPTASLVEAAREAVTSLAVADRDRLADRLRPN